MVNTESLLSENSNNKNESGIPFRGIAEQSKRNSVGFDLSWTNSNETDNVYSISGPDTHRYSSSNSNSNLDLINTSMNQSSSSKNLETGNEANQSDHTVERKGKSKRRRSIIGLSKDRKVNSETASAIIAVVYDAKVSAHCNYFSFKL